MEAVTRTPQGALIAGLLQALWTAAQPESLGRYRGQPIGPLRLNAGRAVATSLLRAVLLVFRKAFPAVQVEVFIGAGFRLDDSVDKDMVAVPFGPPLQVAVVGSPDYLKSRSIPMTVPAPYAAWFGVRCEAAGPTGAHEPVTEVTPS